MTESGMRTIHLNERGRYLLFAWSKHRAFSNGGWLDFIAASDTVKELMEKYNELLLDEPDKIGHIFDTKEFIIICYGKPQQKGKWLAINEPVSIMVKDYDDNDDQETDWSDDD